MGIKRAVDAITLARAMGMRISGKLEARTYFDHYYKAVEGEPTEAQIMRAADAVLAIAGVNQHASVLDLGCGAGFLSIELARRGHRVVGVDRSAVLIATARRLAQGAGLSLNFVVGNIEDLSLEHASELVVAWGGVLGYGTRRQDEIILRKAASLVCPRGTLVVTLFNPEYFASGSASNCSLSASQGLLCVDVERRNGLGRRCFNVRIRSVRDIRKWAPAWVRDHDEVVRWDGMSLGPSLVPGAAAPEKCPYVLYVARNEAHID